MWNNYSTSKLDAIWSAFAKLPIVEWISRVTEETAEARDYRQLPKGKSWVLKSDYVAETQDVDENWDPLADLMASWN